MMRKFFKDILTERNGDFDSVRLLGIIGFLNYLFVGSFEMIKQCSNFNLIEFSSGMAIILGVVAGGVTYKYKSELPNSPPSP